MNYRITIITLEKGSEILERKKLKTSSETPLTVAQIKAQCFAELQLDESIYTKGTEEVWTQARNSKDYAALADETQLIGNLHSVLEYYITVTKK